MADLIKALKNFIRPTSSSKTKTPTDHKPSWMYRNE